MANWPGLPSRAAVEPSSGKKPTSIVCVRRAMTNRQIAQPFLIQDPHPPAPAGDEVTVSIVSHGHGPLVLSLLADLAGTCPAGLRVLLTLNIPESLDVVADRYPFPVAVIHNPAPKGFGANHNAAFAQAHTPFFCILNPDIRITRNPFPPLLAELKRPGIGVAAPKIVNPGGGTEDSARRFPTPAFLIRKLFGLTPTLDYDIAGEPLSPDWVAGMFMVFRRDAFAEVSGFDERYFLYYEDVDLCHRLRRHGYDVRLVPCAEAIHDARRESRRSLPHLRWHVASLARFLLTR
jgi:GT2 family glycosyltransferase